ncbi:TPR-like protein [Dioscorea alata]|uniref:TPR-like protein n=1 Tax=Dioscorea alata TaxID=55571 RepID=A0ACB7VJK5_DIOAL|nr:TPR-like protein [Dioscorea alata]
MKPFFLLRATRTPHPSVLSSVSSLSSDSSSSLILQTKHLLRKSQDRLHVLSLIDSGSLQPRLDLYSDLIKQCTNLKKLREGMAVHQHFLSSRFNPDIFLLNSVVNMYCKCGSLEDARKVFDEMPERDVVTWTALMTGYAQNEQPLDALRLFPMMLGLGVPPNQFTFATLFKAAGAANGYEIGEQVHAVCVKFGCDLDVYVGSSLLDMYARQERMLEACLVFDRLESKNEVSWNALIAGYARKVDGENAMMKFREMQRSGFKATHFTYSSLFSACAGTGALEQGKWVHAHMVKSGQKLIAFIGNTLLDMYAKAGSIQDARKVFDRLDKRDVVSWNSMLKACAHHGLGKETISLFEEMRSFGIQPNHITFVCVLSACSHAGLLAEGQHYLKMMKLYKLEPEVEHYVTVVDLLGRAGLLEQAQKFIDEMPIEPNAAVWGALLGACRMHKNVELGKFAAERVFQLDPHDSGPPVLLSNIYASTGRWTEAAGVRKMMKESGVKKEPACSWVEVENSVHMFVANDDSHPQIEEILKFWEEINVKIKEVGYVPDKNHVLLFVDEEEREARLQYHCEKIALAFALLNMPPGATIRIMKNIRVCGDCHSAIKLVSKVMEREIIVRDKNRFHHFSKGSCSCGDYW